MEPPCYRLWGCPGLIGVLWLGSEGRRWTSYMTLPLLSNLTSRPSLHPTRNWIESFSMGISTDKGTTALYKHPLVDASELPDGAKLPAGVSSMSVSLLQLSLEYRTNTEEYSSVTTATTKRTLSPSMLLLSLYSRTFSLCSRCGKDSASPGKGLKLQLNRRCLLFRLMSAVPLSSTSLIVC